MCVCLGGGGVCMFVVWLGVGRVCMCPFVQCHRMDIFLLSLIFDLDLVDWHP